MHHELLFHNTLFINLFAQSLLFVLNLIAFFGGMHILKHWNFEATTQKQYRLEKRSYLIVLIITISLLFQILLLPFFAYTLDSLSAIVPGAMCAAGVIDANEYGYPLLILKIALLFLIGIWLIINHEDLRAKNFPYLQKKFWFYSMIFILMAVMYLLELLFFSHISLENPVACCSVIFGLSGDNSLPLGLSTTRMLTLFYLFFVLNLLFIWQKHAFMLFVSSLGFLYTAYYSMTHFFGIYIYQLPTHICPFCMLQADYFYSGYLLWGLLFIGVFFGIINALLQLVIQKQIMHYYRYAGIFMTLFVLFTGTYVLFYRLNHGVWL